MKNGLAVALLVALSFSFAATGFAALCASGGVSMAASPSATYLRSYREFIHGPGRLAIDSSGNLYTTDPRTGKIFIRDPYGRLLSVMDGFDYPLGIAVDRDGRIYVGEQGTGTVTVFDQQLRPLHKLGLGDGEFIIPNAIAIDPDPLYGRIYVSDSGAHMIKVYSADGTLLSFFGGKGAGPGQMDFPVGLYISPVGQIFVADQNNDRIQVFDRSGTFLRCFQVSVGRTWYFGANKGRIQGLTGDSQGRLYVADAFQGYVEVFDGWGASIATIGKFGAGPGQFRTPIDLAIDLYNRLFVSSTNNARVEIFGLDRYSDPHVIPAVVDVEPNTLKRSSRRKSITAYIEIRNYRLEQINRATINAYGVPARPWPTAIGDHNENGIPDLMVKFDAQSLLSLLPDGQTLIIVSGEFMDRTLFEGSATVRIIQGQGKETEEEDSEEEKDEHERHDGKEGKKKAGGKK